MIDDISVKTNNNKPHRKKYKINKSFGNKQAWRWIKKHKWLNIGQPITEKQFGIIVKTINKALVDKLLNGSDIIFPNKMGKLELSKYRTQVKFENGRLKTNRPIDWSRTTKLWNEDPISKKNKVLVRYETPYIYRVDYRKLSKSFKNQSFFQFDICRDFKLKLKNKINNNQLDAFLKEY